MVDKQAIDAGLTEGTASFVKKTGRDTFWEMAKETYDKLIDKKTGLVYEHMVESRKCCVCKSNETKLLFVKDGFCHVRCKQCSFVYVNPVLKEDILNEIYATNKEADYWIDVTLTESQRKFDQAKYEEGMELISRYIKTGKVLDVGCGVGHFLEIARDAGWDTVGIELNKKGVEYARNLGLNIIDKPLNRSSFSPNSFDVVTLWEVLEHVTESSLLLEDIRYILRDNGILLILVPNIDSIAVRIMHEKSSTFGGKSHLIFFNLKTISRLLKDNGLIVETAETIVSELGTINNYLNFEEPYSGCADTVLDFLTPEYIHKKLLGYKLMTVAVKKT